MSLKSALMYFQATEYVLWSLSYTVWIRLEFLLIYNQAGPSKKEIIAKKSNFQRKIWKKSRKCFITKITKTACQFLFLGVNFFPFVWCFYTPQTTPKKFWPLRPLLEVLQNPCFFTLIPFSSFSSHSGPPKKFPVIP